MPKLVVLIRERQSENWLTTDHFIAQDHVNNPEDAMRKAVNDYLSSPDGQYMIEHTCGDFNWGDAVIYVSTNSWKKHGIEPIYNDKTYTIAGEIVEITVNQDEVLIREEHDAIFNDKS